MRVVRNIDPRWKRQDRCNEYHLRFRQPLRTVRRFWQRRLPLIGRLMLLDWSE
jgi:hypothetical protein